MSEFTRALAARNPNPAKRDWIYIPYDQLSDQIGPLAREPASSLGIVLVENPWKAARRPYHRQKLALILANMRHFAIEQAERGVAIRHVIANGPYHAVLESLVDELGPLRVMRPAERELRADLEPLVNSGKLVVIDHEGWLTTRDQFKRAAPNGPPWRMDAFYRLVRRDTGVLMEKGKPLGGKFSFDTENRRPWRGDPPAPEPLTFPVDPIKEEVGRLIERAFPRHPGRLDLENLPSTKVDAESAWRWAREQALPHFGPFEDAMSVRSSTLFHGRVSSLVNLHRLLPARLIADTLSSTISLASKEAFIRQILGWREFVRHVHDVTDGFRRSTRSRPAIVARPGDGGYRRWSGEDWPTSTHLGDPDGGAAPNALGQDGLLPPAFWGTPSGLHCLDHVVRGVWNEGYSHHITRLMILSNIASLLDTSPRELTDWFWVAYTDAFDWVVEPNVLGMGTFALGDLMTTKPYVSGAAYIAKMSDYCGDCAFDPKSNCPVSSLYWAYLARHESSLRGNQRLAMPLASLRKRSAARRESDRQTYEITRERLANGDTVSPECLPESDAG